MEYVVHPLLCLIIILLACPVMADTGAAVAPTAPAETPAVAAPEQDAVAKRRVALEQRINAKWDALIRRDFAAAYSLTSPAYRSLSSLDDFKRKFAVGRVVWRRIEVVDVDFKGDDAAVVGINVHFVYYQAQPEKTVEMTTYVQESWVQVDGQWWFLMKE